MIFSLIVRKMGGYFGLRKRYKNTSSKLSKKIYAYINRGFQHETNAYLPFSNIIEGPINFLHGTYGIFISGGATIGKNCTIFQQVTIGSNTLIDSKGFGFPSIGNNCLIGAGAKIIGNVKIGDNCRIGANAVVVEDLPDNSICVLGKSFIIQKENLSNHIYQFKSEGWGYAKDGGFVLEKDLDILKQLKQYEK